MTVSVETRRRAGLTANLLVSVAVKLLPASERDRYDTEWRSEVFYSPVRWRWGTALSLVGGALSVSRELKFRPDVAAIGTTKGLRCRLGIHHDVKVVPLHPTGPSDFYFECVRCGHFRDSAGGGDMLGEGPHPGVF